MKSLQEEADSLRDGLREKELQLRNASEQQAALMERDHVLEEELQQLRERMADAGKRSQEELRLVKEQKAEALRQLREHFTRQGQEVELQNALKEAQQSLQARETALDDKKKTIQLLEAKINRMQLELRARDERIRLQELQHDYAEEKENGAKMGEQVTSQNNSVLQTKLKRVQETCIRLKGELKSSEIEQAALASYTTHHSAEDQRKDRDVQRFKAMLVAKTNALSDTEERFRQAKVRVERLQTNALSGTEERLRQANVRVGDLERGIREQTAATTALRNELGNSQTRSRDLERELHRVSENSAEEVRQLRAANKQLDYTVQERSIMAESLKNALKHAENDRDHEMERVARSTTALEAELRATGAARCHLEEQLETSSRNVVALKNRLRTADGEIQRLAEAQQINTKLQAQLRDAMARTKQAEASAAKSLQKSFEFNIVKEQRDTLTRRLSKTQQDEAQLRQDLDNQKLQQMELARLHHRAQRTELSEQQARSQLSKALNDLTGEQKAHFATLAELRSLQCMVACRSGHSE